MTATAHTPTATWREVRSVPGCGCEPLDPPTLRPSADPVSGLAFANRHLTSHFHAG